MSPAISHKWGVARAGRGIPTKQKQLSCISCLLLSLVFSNFDIHAYYCTSIFTRCLDVFKILCLLHLFKFSSLNRENVVNNDLHQCQNCSTLVIIVSPCEDRRRHLDSRTTAQFESKVMFDARVAAASSTRAEVGRRGHSLQQPPSWTPSGRR